MRHFRSILYALVLAPAVWVLAGVGFTHDLTARGRDDFAVESVTGVLLLVLAGAAYAILLSAPISPSGPLLGGLVYLGISAWALASPAGYAGAWPDSLVKDGFDVSRPGYGLAALLALPLVCTALSARRWARYEPPVLPLIGQVGRAAVAVGPAARFGGPDPSPLMRFPAVLPGSDDTTTVIADGVSSSGTRSSDSPSAAGPRADRDSGSPATTPVSEEGFANAGPVRAAETEDEAALVTEVPRETRTAEDTVAALAAEEPFKIGEVVDVAPEDEATIALITLRDERQTTVVVSWDEAATVAALSNGQASTRYGTVTPPSASPEEKLPKTEEVATPATDAQAPPTAQDAPAVADAAAGAPDSADAELNAPAGPQTTATEPDITTDARTVNHRPDAQPANSHPDATTAFQGVDAQPEPTTAIQAGNAEPEPATGSPATDARAEAITDLQGDDGQPSATNAGNEDAEAEATTGLQPADAELEAIVDARAADTQPATATDYPAENTASEPAAGLQAVDARTNATPDLRTADTEPVATTDTLVAAPRSEATSSSQAADAEPETDVLRAVEAESVPATIEFQAGDEVTTDFRVPDAETASQDRPVGAAIEVPDAVAAEDDAAARANALDDTRAAGDAVNTSPAVEAEDATSDISATDTEPADESLAETTNGASETAGVPTGESPDATPTQAAVAYTPAPQTTTAPAAIEDDDFEDDPDDFVVDDSVETYVVGRAKPAPNTRAVPPEFEETRSLEAPDPDRTRAINLRELTTKLQVTPAAGAEPANPPIRARASVAAPETSGPDLSGAEVTRSLTAPDPDRTQTIKVVTWHDAAAAHPTEHAATDDGEITRSLSAPDPDRTQTIKVVTSEDIEATRPLNAPDPDRTQAIRGAAVDDADPDRTHLIRLRELAPHMRLLSPESPAELDGHPGQAPGHNTAAMSHTGDVGGDETQAIEYDPERTQIIRPGTVEPPGERTQYIRLPVRGGAADAERPDFAEDPTGRLPQLDGREATDADARRGRTVMSMEDGPEIPAQRGSASNRTDDRRM